MKVIREAIIEAFQNVEKYGGVWHVLNNPEFDVVKPSYFFNEDGTRKDKPWYSLFDTELCKYTSNKVSYVDGDLSFETLPNDEIYWGNKVEEEKSEEIKARGITIHTPSGGGSLEALSALILSQSTPVVLPTETIMGGVSMVDIKTTKNLDKMLEPSTPPPRYIKSILEMEKDKERREKHKRYQRELGKKAKARKKRKNNKKNRK